MTRTRLTGRRYSRRCLTGLRPRIAVSASNLDLDKFAFLVRGKLVRLTRCPSDVRIGPAFRVSSFPLIGYTGSCRRNVRSQGLPDLRSACDGDGLNRGLYSPGEMVTTTTPSSLSAKITVPETATVS